jgi:hypothetical protein
MYINLFLFFVSFLVLSPWREDDYKFYTRFHLLVFVETKAEDNDKHASSLSFAFFSYIAKDND